MDSALTYARQWKLRPGIALSAEQVAQLTSDMVWLVTQEVTLADGSKQSVLVPQVYVRVQPGDVDGTGALLAGRDVQLNLSADATNSGTIAGRNLVQINANNIQNMGGTMSADTLALQAKEDIDNIGGQMKAQSAALLSAGRDINLRTTTQSSTNKSRGCHMVVCENARSSSGGHGCSAARRSSCNKRRATTSQTATQTQINGQLVIGQGFNTTVQIPEGALKTQIEALSQQSGQAYLAELASNPQVNWEQIKLVHDQWQYSQQGLTGAGAAVSFVNNGGDLGQTLKDLGSKDSVKNVLLSMATAGALQNLSEVMTIDGQKLSAINAKDSTFGANLGKNLINNMASATMNSALTGAKLEDSLKTALTSAVISAGAGQTASTIGDMAKESPAVKALAHALAGCVAGAAGSGSQGCQSGAIGAVVGELAAQWVNPDGLKSNGETLEFVRVVSAVAGAMTGDGSAQSVNTAVMTGVIAAENNYLNHTQWKEFTDKLVACKGESGCEGRSPHNCYGTSGSTANCEKQWDNIPKSNALEIRPNSNYKPPFVIPQYQQVDKVTPQVQQDSNSQMNQLLQPIAPLPIPTEPLMATQIPPLMATSNSPT